MDKSLLLAASFGTTYQDTCEKNIGAVEDHLAAVFPQWAVRRAFTSAIVRKVLAKRGIEVDDVPAALEKAKEEGFRRVVIQPTHLLYGVEYEKLQAQAKSYEGDFGAMAIGGPLLADYQDMLAVCDALSCAFPPEKGRALVLFGHGTHHYVNPVYAAMQTAFRLGGRKDVFVGTVEAWPTIEDVLDQLLAGDYQSVTLTPLMLVAGDHAENDMLGEDSWKSLLEESGFAVTGVLRGLGEYPAIRRIYEDHARKAMDQYVSHG